MSHACCAVDGKCLRQLAHHLHFSSIPVLSMQHSAAPRILAVEELLLLLHHRDQADA
jgi:hypothetical protein